MSDERGRGAADDDRAEVADGPAEPEFGSSDWLLQQLTGGRHVERPAEPAEEAAVPAEPEAGRFDDLLNTADEAPAEEEPATEFPVSFSWNLTPGAGADPLVQDATSAVDENLIAAAALEEEAEVPPAVVAPKEPERAPEPEPLSAPVLADPEPLAPEPDDADDEPEPAVRSWVIPAPEPEPEKPAEPEPPRTIFDPPPPAPAAPDESHGLAALLGLGEPESSEPSGRSVIGDTTSVIPIDPSALRPTSAFETPAAPEPPPPVLPAVDATPAPEPVAYPSSTDTPTQALDAAEIAALLRSGRPEPDTVLPSQPAIPAAEAELALGGVPSPATSPIDAASIAAASDPSESDGLAALFGDVGTEHEEHEDEAVEPEPAPAPEPEAEPEPEQEQDRIVQPAADLEGPQLTATMPFTVPPAGDDEPRVTGRYARAEPPRFTPLATAAAAVPAAAVAAEAPSVAPTAAAAPAAAAVPVAPGGPTPPGGPAGTGLWGSRNNRILLLALGALAVVLVLIGLFALGTRIPSLLGAPKAAPQPTTSSSAAAATPSASPTPTPVPTVTPKPAAAVGPGTHPWYSLGGGECIQPFTSVWAEEFTVVDCSAPHTAQLVYTNVLSADPAAAYPGVDALTQQIPGLCTAGGVVDLAAAAAYPDLQVIGSYPATEQQWKDGQRSYYCFANRSSGQPLTSSVAGPGPA